MDEIEEIDNYSIITDYDDGVVCFGKVTQSQIERQKRLPRHTILPSDIQLSESFLNSSGNDEDDGNDETLSEDQNTFAFAEDRVEDEMVSYVDVQEEEPSTIKCIHNETNSCTPSVSNVIEESMNDHKISDSANNICTLKHCSQLEDEDVSYYCNSELGELETFDEYSIVPDEFTITPGKQRLFDTRLAKSLIHAKTFDISQAKDTSTVAEQSLNSKISLNNMSDIIVSTADVNDYNNVEESDVNEVSVKCNIVVDNILDETMCTSLLFPCDKSKVFDNSSSEISQAKDTSTAAEQSFNNKKSLNNTSDIIVSTADVNDYNEEKSETMEVDIKSTNSSVVDEIFDETICTSLLFSNNKSEVFNNSSNKIGQDINTSSVTEQTLNNKESMNNTSNIIVSTADVNNYNNVEESDVKEVSVKYNSIVVDNILDETMCTSLLFPSDKSKVFDNSSSEISQAKDTSTAVEQSLNNKKSLNYTSDIIISTADVNDYNEEKSETMGVDIKSTNSSVVDEIFDETICTSLLFYNNKSEVFNNSSNKIGQDINTSSVTEQTLNNKESMNNTSNIIVSTADVNNYNNVEESDVKEVSVKYNSIVVDNILDETMCTSLLFPSDKSKVFDNSSSKISQAKDTSTAAEQSFNNKKSLNNTSEIIVSTADVNDYNEEKSETMEVDIRSTNSSVVDEIFDETICTSLLFSNNKSEVFNNSSNEIDQDKNTSSVTELSLNNKESMNNMSNIIVSTADVNNYNNVEESDVKEVSVKYNSIVVDNILDETMCTSLLFPSDKSKVFDNSSSEISQAKDTSTAVEQSLNNKKSLNYTSDIIISTADVNDYNEEKSETMGVDITSTNSSVVDEIFDETICTSLLFSNNKSEVFNNSSNEIDQDKNTSSVTELSLNNKKSMNNMSNLIVSTADVDDYNEKKSNAMEVNIKSNAGVVVTILDETMCTSLLFANDNNKNLNNSSNETDVVRCSLNVDVQDEQFEKSINDSTISVSKYNINEIQNNEEINKSTNQSKMESIISEGTLKSGFKEIDNNKFEIENKSDQKDQNVQDTSVKKHNKLEQISNFGENKELQAFDCKTPKIQKLLDFSIMQQMPTFENQIKKQKLLDFSIVNQTPTRNSTQQIYLDENSSGKKDVLIDFSVDNKMLDLKPSPDEVDLKGDCHNTSIYSLSKNLPSNVASDVKLLIDEPDNTNTSNRSDLSFNQTITDTNLNLSTNPITVNDFKHNIDGKTTEETNGIVSLDKDVGSGLLVDEQIVADESSNSLNNPVEQVNLELFNKSESKQSKYCYQSSMNDTTGDQNQSACLLNTTLNQSIKKSDFTDITTDQNKPLTFSSYQCAIKDFSIIEQQTMKLPESKTDINSLPAESYWNVSNLIEMSVVSNIDSKSNDQTLVTSDNSSDNKSEKSITISSDEIIDSAINIKTPMFSYTSEILTDVQMSDVTLTQSPKKSSIEESGGSKEPNQQKDNKRKLDLDQELQNYEKKFKIETNDPKTPISMLYKFRNMYKSSEKSLIYKSNTKENDLKSDKCHQKLNFSKVEENENKPLCYKRTEVLVKSKIPCKMNDKLMSKNCEFNNSSLSLNDSIKQKRAIPRLIGTPVLSDLSNSSKRKCPESRIPSILKK